MLSPQVDTVYLTQEKWRLWVVCETLSTGTLVDVPSVLFLEPHNPVGFYRTPVHFELPSLYQNQG